MTKSQAALELISYLYKGGNFYELSPREKAVVERLVELGIVRVSKISGDIS